MADLDKQFEQAVAASRMLDERPGNTSLLRLYALYKQATAGDIEGARPGFTDMVGGAKWDAWHALSGTPTTEAMQRYIDLVNQLKG